MCCLLCFIILLYAWLVRFAWPPSWFLTSKTVHVVSLSHLEAVSNNVPQINVHEIQIFYNGFLISTIDVIDIHIYTQTSRLHNSSNAISSKRLHADWITLVSQTSGNSSRKYCVPYGICPYVVDEFSSDVYGFGGMCLPDWNLKVWNTV